MEIISLIQAGATPLIALVLVLQWKTDQRIHKIDRRMVRVETKLGVTDSEKSD